MADVVLGEIESIFLRFDPHCWHCVVSLSKTHILVKTQAAKALSCHD